MPEEPNVTPYDKSEREFLHDLCNPLAICYGNIKLLAAKLQKNQSSLDQAAILEKLDKAINSFDRANVLLERRRHFLRSQDND